MLIMLLMSSALAAESEFAGTEKPPEETPEEAVYTASLEFGGVYAAGNSESYALSGAANASAKWRNNKFSMLGAINRGSSRVDVDGDGRIDATERAAPMVKNVERYSIQGRYDRFLSAKDSLYVLAGAYSDQFAGFDLRSHQQLGYSRTLVASESTSLVAELGFDYAQENYVAGIDPNYADVFAARLMIGLAHKFNENVSFTDTVEAYENVMDPNDLRLLNTATLSASLSNRLALKLSHSLIFDNVPVEGFRKLDHTSMVTLVATLL